MMAAYSQMKNPGVDAPGQDTEKPAKALPMRYNSLNYSYAQRVEAWKEVLIDFALHYARHGYPVFPVRSDKRPYVKWSVEATTDPDKIRAWWQKWPLAMIGMPTGSRSGLAVLDVDTKNGVDGFASLKAAGFEIPIDAIKVITPSGGAHFYFKMPKGVKVQNSAGKIGPGVDLRGDGGMIILPPSRPDFDGLGYDYAPSQGKYGEGVERGVLIW